MLPILIEELSFTNAVPHIFAQGTKSALKRSGRECVTPECGNVLTRESRARQILGKKGEEEKEKCNSGIIRETLLARSRGSLYFVMFQPVLFNAPPRIWCRRDMTLGPIIRDSARQLRRLSCFISREFRAIPSLSTYVRRFP